jgi:predicted nucleic acid-binding protein
VARVTHLLDNSVYARLGHPTVSRPFLELQGEGRLARCGVFELEALFSARSPRQLHEQLIRALPLVPTHQADFDRAAEVMLLLADRGRHRAVGAADLILAAGSTWSVLVASEQPGQSRGGRGAPRPYMSPMRSQVSDRRTGSSAQAAPTIPYSRDPIGTTDSTGWPVTAAMCSKSRS